MLCSLNRSLMCSHKPMHKLQRNNQTQRVSSRSPPSGKKQALSKSVLGDMLAKGNADQEFHRDLTKAFSTSNIPLAKVVHKAMADFFEIYSTVPCTASYKLSKYTLVKGW